MQIAVNSVLFLHILFSLQGYPSMLANAIVHRLSQGCLRNALSSGHIRGLSTSRCLRLPNEFDSKPDPVVVKFHSSGQLLPHQQWVRIIWSS